MPSICVPIQAKTIKELQKKLREAKVVGADMVEIWLDHLSSPSGPPFGPLSVLAVCKSPFEKGFFRGSEAERAKILIAASRWANMIDIPLSMPEKLISRLSSLVTRHSSLVTSSCKIILSHHDFQKTPSDSALLRLARRMRNLGADIVKIACQARSQKDAWRMVVLASRLQKEGIPHILIAMGKHGRISRVLTPLLGGAMMFAPVRKTAKTAPGQFTVAELRNFWNSSTLATS
ncbi:type I 3-dehydroquinate dehydratase [Candidatus Peregrinibacteria bacterium]|nr:type I 3-dehydroquinate dehydratase [Candidatus Peregrinibacteria bacterium]